MIIGLRRNLQIDIFAWYLTENSVLNYGYFMLLNQFDQSNCDPASECSETDWEMGDCTP